MIPGMNNDTAHRNAAYKWLTSRNIDERMDNAEDIVLAELTGPICTAALDLLRGWRRDADHESLCDSRASRFGECIDRDE